MKPIQKHIIVFSGFAIFILFGYFAFQNFTPFQSDEVRNSLSQSRRETNTGKSLETVSHSGNQWGGNPFESGTSVPEEKVVNKPVFKKPNTEWKARTLSGITYVFGEGNPKEVAPKLSDYKYPNQDYFHDAIVRPKTEKRLKEFLENPVLITVMNKCGSLLQAESDPNFSNLLRNLPISLYTIDLSMENTLLIDPITGRKVINGVLLNDISRIFSQIQSGKYQHQLSMSSIPGPPLMNDCLLKDEILAFEELMRQLSAIDSSYFNESEENKQEVFNFINGK